VLNGRFDLLVLSSNTAHIFDWKTGQPRSEADLRHDWQTRLYLAMLAEGSAALGQTLQPEQIAITYWYVNEPAAPRTIRYNQAWHTQNWADIQTVVSQINAALAENNWPLTEEWAHCRHCAYQSYCGRQEAGTTIAEPSEETADESGIALEPELP
jgi:CRISPR/Cas system-associated exonuclease Cas4 (RecB family)